MPDFPIPLPDDLESNGRVGVRVNGGATTLKRRRVNFLNTSAVTWTVADDPVNEEVDLTLAVGSAAPSGAAGGVLSGTYPDPGFAVDMATQAELDTGLGTKQATITGAWATYTPALTASISNPTLGTGNVVYGHYLQLGRLVVGTAYIQFGTSGVGAGSGNYFVSLPVTPRALDTGETTSIASGRVRDASPVTNVIVEANTTSTTYPLLFMTTGDAVSVGSATPWTWAASDAIQLRFMYEASTG